MPSSILAVSTSSKDLRNLHDSLHDQGNVILTLEPSQAVELLRDQPFDLIIVCYPLTTLSSNRFCRQVRSASDCPMLAVCTSDDSRLRVELLESGADMCLLKPFTKEELKATANALLRRYHKQISVYYFGGFRIDLKAGEVWHQNQLIEMTWREFDLLRFFVLHEGEVVSREQIITAVWQKSMDGPTRTVDQYVMRLRRWLAAYDEHEYLQTVHGYGYKFTANNQ